MTLCIVTGTRAEYGILKPLIQRLNNSSDFELRLVATGTHLSEEFGNTFTEILSDGFTLSAKIPIIPKEKASTSQLMSNAIVGFDKYFSEHRPDAVILLGDRYEILSVAISAYNLHIPIIHLYGGDTTEGALDEAYRHAITKMSFLHFVSNDESKKRVIQLGENPEHVFNVGSLGVENALKEHLLSVEELEHDFSIPLKSGYAVVTFHPVTLEDNTVKDQCDALLHALETRNDLTYIITKSNADDGGSLINSMLDEFCKSHSNTYITASLGMRRYLSAVSHAKMVIGNSSSGIYEVPAFHVPTVNIGDRQRGRLSGKSVLHCPPTTDAILSAMNHAEDPSFIESIRDDFGVYGDGTSSEKIECILQNQLLNKTPNLKKRFFDLG